jgi:hypothetical protein
MKKKKSIPSKTVTERAERIQRYLENEVWPTMPKHLPGKRITKKERERILGYGRHGV